MAYDTLEC